MTYNFDSEVDCESILHFDYKKLYEDVVDAVLDNEKCPFECEVSICIVDDESIKEINMQQRKIDKATDVLSFPMNEYVRPGNFEGFEDEPAAFNPETGELLLGDIVLSVDHVLAQAYEYGHSIEREYAFLIAHSMLHLCGYDHIIEEERILMESRQKSVMESLYDKYPSLNINELPDK